MTTYFVARELIVRHEVTIEADSEEAAVKEASVQLVMHGGFGKAEWRTADVYAITPRPRLNAVPTDPRDLP